MNQISRDALAGLALCLIASAAIAQPVPNAGSLLRQQEQLEKQAPSRMPEEAVTPETVRPALRSQKGVVVEVKAIRFSGAVDLVPERELQEQVSYAIGKKLDFAGLQAVADKVTAYLKGKGYLLARAYLPRQDVTSGTIEIAILRGRLDGTSGHGGWKLLMDTGTRIDRKRLTALAERAAPSGSVLRQGKLERALLLMDDIPGVNVRARLEPGANPGTTRVVAEVKEGPRFTGNAWADNYGNYSTGEAETNAALDLNDPSGRGDHARLALTASEGITMARAGYDLPLGATGLRGDVGYTAMHYDVRRGSGVTAGLSGDSAIAHAGLSYPIIRSRKLNLYASAGYDHKALKDDSTAGVLRDKRVDALDVGLNGDSLDTLGGGGYNSWSLQLTSGHLDLSRVAADEAADAATLRTAGGYNKLGWNLSRLQRLSSNFTLLGRFSGQFSDKNLDSSEQFILGGPAGVRAYPVGEAQGDEGWLASLDLRYDVPGSSRLGNIQLSAFADSGGIRLHKDPGSVAIPTATGENTYQLSGAGVGVSVGKAANYRLSLVWAHTLGDNPGRTVTGANADGKHDDNRFWLQAVAWF